MELHLIEVIKSLGGTMVTDETEAAIVQPRWEGVSVFVASDHPLVGSGPTGMSWLTEHFNAKSIEGGLSDMETGYLRPQVDLAIMDMANHMVGHCPSSFSHVSARMRLARASRFPIGVYRAPCPRSRLCTKPRQRLNSNSKSLHAVHGAAACIDTQMILQTHAHARLMGAGRGLSSFLHHNLGAKVMSQD